MAAFLFHVVRFDQITRAKKNSPSLLRDSLPPLPLCFCVSVFTWQPPDSSSAPPGNPAALLWPLSCVSSFHELVAVPGKCHDTYIKHHSQRKGCPHRQQEDEAEEPFLSVVGGQGLLSHGLELSMCVRESMCMWAWHGVHWGYHIRTMEKQHEKPPLPTRPSPSQHQLRGVFASMFACVFVCVCVCVCVCVSLSLHGL